MKVIVVILGIVMILSPIKIMYWAFSTDFETEETITEWISEGCKIKIIEDKLYCIRERVKNDTHRQIIEMIPFTWLLFPFGFLSIGYGLDDE